MKRLYFIGLLVIFLLVGAGYSSHMLSSETRVNISGVFDVDGRNWTAPNATEIFNFTVVNDGGSNDSVVSVNITIDSAFTLNASTINSSSNFACTNATPLLINCTNTSAEGLGIGNTMYVWFNVTSDSVGSEMPNEWIINTSDNATGLNGTVLYSWIDGAVSEAAELDALDAYVNLQPVVLNWTNHSGCDNVSGILNYRIYNSTGGAVNFTVFDTTVDTNYSVSGLVENQNHSFIVETRDKAENALNSSLVWTVIDTIAPVVELNTTDNENFSYTYYPRLYFNVTDKYDDNLSCEVFVDGYPNGTSYIQNATGGLSIQVDSSLLGESMEWYVNCTDDAGNTGNSSTRVLNVVGADVVVESVYFNTTADTNPIASDDMKVFAVVKNVGNRNISENVTVAFYLDGDHSIGSSLILNETLTAGQNKTVNITYAGSLKQYLPVSFNHTLKAEATANSATELNATNNDAYNYSLYVGYNVTITSIDSTRNPGDNLTVNLMVRYPNGTGVTGIPEKNFTVMDTFSLTTITWGGLQLSKPTGDGWTGQNVYNDSFSEDGGGTYSFRISTFNDTSIIEAGTTRPGPHTVQVDIESNMTGRNSKGRSEDSYNLTAPMFDIIYKVRGESTDLNGNADLVESSSEDYNIYVVNNGHANLTSVNISVTTFDTNALLSVTEHSCSSQKDVPNDGSQVYVCYITVTTKAITSDDSSEIDIVAYGSYNGNRYSYDEDDFVISVEDSTTTTTTETTTTGTTTTDTDYPNCAVNDDCFGDEFCNSHLVCEELDCADDEKILDHACVKKDVSAAVKTADYSLAVTDGPSELEIEHGESRNTTFKLKNNGEKTLTELKFELGLKDATVNISEWYAVLSNYSTTLKKGIVESVKVEINTADFSIGVYEIIAFAKSGNASGNLTFTLKVTPDDDEKVVINDTMVKLDSDYTEIYNQLQVLLHENVNNTNLTALNDTLAKVGEYLMTAKLAIESGDYLSAYQNQRSADSLMVEIKSKLDGDDLVKGEKKSHLLRNSLIVVVLAVLGVFGFQYYRNMQESGGYHPEKGFRIKKKSEFREKIMGEISALKRSIRGKKEISAPTLKPTLNYASYNSNKKQDNILKRIAEKFRAKRQNPNQKTLYDIGNVYNKKVRKKKVFCC